MLTKMTIIPHVGLALNLIILSASADLPGKRLAVAPGLVPVVEEDLESSHAQPTAGVPH